MNPLELYRRAVAEFGRRVEQTTDSQWSAATPDSDWDVRALVRHLVSENLWIRPLLEGQTIAQVGDRFEGNILGSDPKAAFAQASATALQAFDQPGALERTVHLSFGDLPASAYAMQMFMDHLIHAWDLATAIGADQKLDPDLVAVCHAEMLKQAADWRAGGAFGPEITPPDGADLQTKLLALTGRQA